MQATKQDEVRVYVVFGAEEYAALEEMAIEQNREIRAQVRRCVADAVTAFRARSVVGRLTALRRILEAQAGGNLQGVFGEVCLLDDVASALDLSARERRQVLGERFATWLDGPAAVPTPAVQMAYGHGRPGADGLGMNGGAKALPTNKTALAGNGKATRQG